MVESSNTPRPVPDPMQWARIDAIFHEALAVPDEKRDAVVMREADNDCVVYAEVKRLLEVHRRTGSFLSVPSRGQHDDDQRMTERLRTLRSLQVDPTRQEGHTQSGAIVGRFTLVELVSLGGMGEVWMAERTDDAGFHQRAALKILKQSWLHEGGRDLFLRERQTLARLEHPAITRLIDGGQTGDGRPYFVMEFVEGEPIDKFCDRKKMTVRERLCLFMQVCDAVDYAHQSLIIHRDLKPTNILVTKQGRPKLLDFGIADLVESQRGEQGQPPVTRRVLSPDYASPEQLRGDPCTTATDIYSLGLVLHKLVCGTTPRQGGGMITQAATAFSHQESTTLSKPTPTAAAARRTTVRKLSAALAGDLHWILERALQPDQRLRYRFAGAFRDDIARHLSSHPITSRPSTLRYRLTSSVKRNPLLAACLAILMVTLIGGIVTSTLGWRHAREEREAAVAATAFLESVYGSVTPYAIRREPNLIDVLAAASDRARTELKDRPAVEQRVRFSLANIYGSLWEWELALPEAERALSLARMIDPTDLGTIADCQSILGRAYTWRHRRRAAVEVQESALANRRTLFGDLHPKVADSKITLAFALWWSKIPESIGLADQYYRDGLADFRKLGQDRSATFARSAYSYANFLKATAPEREAEARDLLRESVTAFDEAGEPPDRYAARARYQYGRMLVTNDQVDEGVKYLADYLSMAPPDMVRDESLVEAHWIIANVQHIKGELHTAQSAYRQMIIAECRFRGSDAALPNAWSEWADKLEAADSPTKLLESLGPLIEQLQASEHPNARFFMGRLGTAIALLSHFADPVECENHIVELCTMQRRYYPGRTDLRENLHVARAEALINQKRYIKAVALLQPSLRALEREDVVRSLYMTRAENLYEQIKQESWPAMQ